MWRLPIFLFIYCFMTQTPTISCASERITPTTAKRSDCRNFICPPNMILRPLPKHPYSKYNHSFDSAKVYRLPKVLGEEHQVVAMPQSAASQPRVFNLPKTPDSVDQFYLNGQTANAGSRRVENHREQLAFDDQIARRMSAENSGQFYVPARISSTPLKASSLHSPPPYYHSNEYAQVGGEISDKGRRFYEFENGRAIMGQQGIPPVQSSDVMSDQRLQQQPYQSPVNPLSSEYERICCPRQWKANNSPSSLRINLITSTSSSECKTHFLLQVIVFASTLILI